MKRAVRGQPSSGPECIGAPAAPNVGVVPCESLAVAQSPWRASPGRHDDLLLDSVGQRQDSLLASVGTAKHASTRQRGTARGPLSHRANENAATIARDGVPCTRNSGPDLSPWFAQSYVVLSGLMARSCCMVLALSVAFDIAGVMHSSKTRRKIGRML